jgi:hypothetical protein
MDGQHLFHSTEERGRRGCLAQGCSCKDARIVSTRRAAFFADLARHNGETANRAISPEIGWRIPVLVYPAG